MALLESVLVSAAADSTRRRWGGLPYSLGLHAVAVALLSIVGIASGTLPEPALTPHEPILLPAIPVVLAAERSAPVPSARRRAVPALQRSSELLIPAPQVSAPVNVPGELTLEPEPIFEQPAVGSCLTGCGVVDGDGPQGSGVGESGIDSGRGSAAPVRPGGQVKSPSKLRHVPPAYPELARRAGVQGTVIVECVIDPRGRVAQARIVRGHPLLDAAALEAVEQWLYTPTRLNDVPVPVLMTVTVEFKLSR